MKKLLFTVVALALLLVPAGVQAQGLEVNFSNDPLFSEGDIKPGDCYVETFSVENESDTSADGYLRTLDASQTKGLATVLDITITDTDSGEEFYADMLAALFSRNTDEESVFLGSVAGGEARNFAFEACFPEASGNEFQLGTADFDLCVGFSGGEESCTGGDGDGNGNSGGGGDSSNGGGGGQLDQNDDGDDPSEDEADGGGGGEVAGAQTANQPEGRLSGLLVELERALQELLASIQGQVLGRRAPTLPQTGDGSFQPGEEGGALSPLVPVGVVLLLTLLFIFSWRKDEKSAG